MRRRFLFIHQNFPGQFVHLSAELARQGHEVVALGIGQRAVVPAGVRYEAYEPLALPRPSGIELARDFEVKLARAVPCAARMEQLRANGFQPDVIVAHPGWGEAMFCKDVWPDARLLVFAEFFYTTNTDFGFDPEFARVDLRARQRLRLKNSVHLHALQAADGGYAPTQWQRNQCPVEFRDRLRVIFDGIDTDRVCPDTRVRLHLQRDGVSLAPGDEVITFVNRNLEPYRGFHVLMRALPGILAARPRARCLIVGGDGVSYGTGPTGAASWREAMLKELQGQLPMDRVHFLGRLSYADYLRVLRVSACHVYLTYPFVLSWSCLEAMSAGCTVVASATAPVQEVIEDGKQGLLFDFFDVQGLQQRVCEVLENPARHRALGAQARQHVIDHYDLRRRCLPMQLDYVMESAGG